MAPIHFDRLAKSLSGQLSRRQAMTVLGIATLAGIAGTGRCPRAALAQDSTPAASADGTRPIFPPIAISRSLAPLYPAPDLYPVVGFDQGEVIPILGPTESFLLDEGFDPTAGFPVVGIADGEILPIINFDPSLIEGPLPTPLPTPSAVSATPTAEEEASCGINDSQDVEFYEEIMVPADRRVARQFVLDHQPPVGNIVWSNDLDLRFPGEAGTVFENGRGARWCSGTLISDDLFLTAGHCFEPDFRDWITPRINGAPIGRPDIARSMRVDFNFQWSPVGPRPVTSVAIAELVEDRLGALDYAIVRLERNPGSDFRRARIAKTDAPQGSVLCLMSHPNQLPKRIATGHASEYQGPRCYYDDLDTDAGSSGGGLLDADGRLVGIHTNGGCGQESGQNHGFRIEALLDVSERLRSHAGP